MQIKFKQAGKRFNRDWIFRRLDFSFNPGKTYVILGGNGSGKSTLLKAALGYAPLSEGSVSFFVGEKEIKQENIYKYFSFCSPYMELYEELSLHELLKFHSGLKPLRNRISAKEFIAKIDLEKAAQKPVKYFSSGMKQRVRIGLAVLSDTACILLDEPVSNLDRRGVEWYQNLIETERKNRTVLVASNHTDDEYFFCEEKLNIEDYKK
jgi:ABC-type multidrug transport system ATPase subunit